MSVPEHTHDHCCPYARAAPTHHAYCPPQKGDSRSPCPALNTLANHGYLPRDGKCVTPNAIMHALRKGYHLSATLAWVLTRGGFYLLGQRRTHICLADLARHNCIEHNASLAHPDVIHRDEYAPLHPCPDMLERFLAHAQDGALMTPDDVARARVLREATYAHPIDALHAEIARGEMAIVMNLFNNPAPTLDPASASEPTRSLFAKLKGALSFSWTKDEPEALPLPGVPVDALRTWMHEERLPDGWVPYQMVTLRHVMQTSSQIRATMKKLEKEAQKRKAAREVRDELAQMDALAVVSAAEAAEGVQVAKEEREEVEAVAAAVETDDMQATGEERTAVDLDAEAQAAATAVDVPRIAPAPKGTRPARLSLIASEGVPAKKVETAETETESGTPASPTGSQPESLIPDTPTSPSSDITEVRTPSSSEFPEPASFSQDIMGSQRKAQEIGWDVPRIEIFSS